MSRLLAVAALALAVLVPLPAAAQVPPAPGARVHDGLFLRLQGGAAYLTMTEGDDGYRGPGYGLHLAIGGSPSEDLVLFGEFVSQTAPDPTMEEHDVDVEAEGATLGFGYLGVGIGTYLGESNVFLSGGLGKTTATIASGPISLHLDGFGARVGLGKEWWIADQWGVGVGADFLTSLVAVEQDELFDDPVTARAFAVTFTATYQ